MDKINILDVSTYKEDILRAISINDFTELKGKKIFVTGASGLIGSSIIDVLIELSIIENFDIFIYFGGRDLSFYSKRYAKYKNVTYVAYDSLQSINLPSNIDFIIHAAGIASPEKYVNNPVETMLTNIRGTNNLLNYCIENSVKRFLFVSSSEIYGKKETCDSFVENGFGTIDLNSIRASYPLSKATSELLCKSYSAEYGVDTVIVRPGHIFGPTARISDKRISSEFTYKAVQGENLVLKSSGVQKRSYCYSVDCACQILFVLLHGNNGEAYNISNSEVTSIKKMAEIIAEFGNVTLNSSDPKQEDEKCFNPMDYAVLDNSKLEQLGYINTFTVREGLEHTVSIIKEIYG